MRRKGKKLIDKVESIKEWERIHIDNTKRKYPFPYIHESKISLRIYEGELRQVIMKGNGKVMAVKSLLLLLPTILVLK